MRHWQYEIIDTIFQRQNDTIFQRQERMWNILTLQGRSKKFQLHILSYLKANVNAFFARLTKRQGEVEADHEIYPRR